MRARIDSLLRRYSERGPVILLESQSTEHPASKVSYLAAIPELTIEARGNKTVLYGHGFQKEINKNPWDALSNFYKEQSDWLFGYLGYDLKNSIEHLHSRNPDPVLAPDLYFMIPSVLIKIDHQEDTLNYIKGSPQEIDEVVVADKQILKVTALNYTIEKDEYLARIKEAKRRISEGDFYEINLSHQLAAGIHGYSYSLYEKMRDIGPVPFGAYLQTDTFSVCCMSPERFLAKQGSRVYSQPIKGTIRRGVNDIDDRELREDLRQSMKNRAENLMIVDLVRNDLSKIAKKGSVKVSDLFEIQTFGTVHQMVSTVEAESGTEDPIDIIKACYPMGSMTGAPKISAMKSIEELENYRRGIYSGAIGYINPAGDFDFNVVIRTAIISGGDLYYSVGGAITGDSDPFEEWEETLVKARALTKVLDKPNE